MSVAADRRTDAEIEDLADLDMEAVPPCQCMTATWAGALLTLVTGNTPRRHLCGRPSVARLKVTCSCGAVYRLFLCRVCAWFFRVGIVECRACGSHGTVRGTGS